MQKINMTIKKEYANEILLNDLKNKGLEDFFLSRPFKIGMSKKDYLEIWDKIYCQVQSNITIPNEYHMLDWERTCKYYMSLNETVMKISLHTFEILLANCKERNCEDISTFIIITLIDSKTEFEDFSDVIESMEVAQFSNESIKKVKAAFQKHEKAYSQIIKDSKIDITKEQKILSSDSDQSLKSIIDKFHIFVLELKKRYNNRQGFKVQDEYDVQDLLRALLRIHFDDVREEEYTPSYAGGSKRMDFLLNKEEIVIEAKMTRKNLTDVKVGEQLTIDITYYKKHPRCKKLICFVYDPENKISNPIGLKDDLEEQSTKEMAVEVYIKP